MTGLETGLAHVNVVLRHEASGSAITLPRGEIHVGRSAACFLRIEDPGVSRVHFRIVVGQMTVVIEDLGSRNGTLVNGARVTAPMPLREGDEIAVGSRVFCLTFVNTGELAFEDDDVTPFPREHRRETLTGVGAISEVELVEACPRCSARVAVRADRCPTGGGRWPREERPAAVTRPEAPTVSRRRHSRRPVTLRARYTSTTMDLKGEIHNLSRSGLFFACAAVEPAGAYCLVEVQETDGTPVRLRGFVRHVIHRGVNWPAGMGIEFTALDPEAEAWLDARLEQRS